jgi:hypothetical protein
MNRTLAALAAAFSMFALTACSSTRVTPSGYWEGSGTAHQTMIKDNFRDLERSAKYEFWFTADEKGDAAGEIEITYDATLTVDNLPSVNVGVASFAPKVGGKLSQDDAKRRYPIVGIVKGNVATIEIAVAEGDRIPLTFVMTADPGVSSSGNLGAGSIGMQGGAVGVSGGTVQKIPMTAFSPFDGPAAVEKRPAGPFAARYEKKGDGYSVEWSARQAGGEKRELKHTAEVDRALQALRAATHAGA